MNAPATTIERAATERPTLMSGPMVRAILDGKKTMTRRIVKPQPSEAWAAPEPREWVLAWDHDPADPTDHGGAPWSHEERVRCPYGAPGDRLYVKEAWRCPKTLDVHCGSKIAEMALEAGYASPWAPIQYEADGTRRDWERSPAIWPQEPGRYRHARFMPRWASRLTLDVLGVRVERLHDITDADIFAEGVTVPLVAEMTGIPWAEIPDLFSAWRLGWIHINGAESWESNPWVWRVSFRRVEKSE